MSKKLQGKTALVTGAAQGMGLAFARALAQEGARVVLTDIQDDAVGREAQSLRSQGLSAESRALDVCQAQAWADAIQAIGMVDILVNNAGIALTGSVEECTEQQWRRVMDVNALGPFLGCQAVIPGMKAAGQGSIINIASLYALVGEPWAVAYSASKGAVTQLTRSAAAQLGASGIRVNSVHPGFIDTPMIAQAIAQLPPDMAKAYTARTIGQVPLGRMATPEDVAGMVVFLASDDARYITGAQLVVDGGFLA